MRFERYPLDEHICKFRVGSTNMDINYMRFGETAVTYDESSRNTILDYKVEAMKLREEDRILLYQGGNYSVTGQTGPTVGKFNLQNGFNLMAVVLCRVSDHIAGVQNF